LHTERVDWLRGVEAFRLALTARWKTPPRRSGPGQFAVGVVRQPPDDRRLPQCLSDLEHTIWMVTQGPQNGQGDTVDGDAPCRAAFRRAAVSMAVDDKFDVLVAIHDLSETRGAEEGVNLRRLRSPCPR